MKGFAWIILTTSTLSLAADEAVDADSFAAKQMGNNIQLNTPYGPRLLWGDGGFDSMPNYRIEIPLDELKTQEQKAAEKKKAEEDAKREAASAPTITKITEIPPEKPPEPVKEEPKKEEPKKVIVEYDETDRFVLEANRLYNRRQFYEATMVVEELLRRRPDYVRGWVMKGSLLHMQGQKDLAKGAWQKAVDLDPENQELKGILKNYR